MPVTLTYRLDGTGHVGKGINLTPEEVDANFQAIQDAIQELEENPPDPVTIADFTVDAATNTFRVFLSDGSEFGPFPLPTTNMKWQGEWEAGRSYFLNDLFTVQGDGVYLVIQAQYEAPTEFDPAEVNSEGLLFERVFGVPSPLVVPVVTRAETTGSISFTVDMLGTYQRVAPGVGQNIFLTPPDDSVLDLPIGSTITFRHIGDGDLWFTETGAVTIDAPDTLQFRKRGSTATIVKVLANTWEVSGDMAVEPLTA